MFSFVFWVLLCWFIVNVIWMWFVLKNQTYQRVFAWINVCAVVIGFWVYYVVAHDPSGIAIWFIWLNWINVVLACLQFYFGYRKLNN